jgi:hypothetical protein
MKYNLSPKIASGLAFFLRQLSCLWTTLSHSILEVARRDQLSHVVFNPIRFSKFIALQHVFWPSRWHLLPEDVRLCNTAFLLLEITRRDWMAHVSFKFFQFHSIFEIVPWLSTSNLLPGDAQLGLTAFPFLCNCKTRSIDTCKFQSLSIFKIYRTASCSLTINVTTVARRC